MSRARSVADLGNQNVLDLNANDGTLKVGAGVTIENTGEVQFAGIVTAATVQIGAATTLHSTGLDLGAGNINSHNITSTGNLSVDGNMSVGGVLTYEDVTSVDSVGIITAQSDVSISDKIIHTGDTNTAIRFPAADTFTVETGGSEAVRVDSSQRLLVGNTSPRSNAPGADVGFQIEGASGGPTNKRFTQHIFGSGDGSGPYLGLAKHRGTSVGGNTIVVDDDELGGIYFQGADGTNFKQGASILGFVDGTPGSNDMPGRLSFQTTSDGASSPTERLRISSDGQIGMGKAGAVTVNGNSPLTIQESDSNSETICLRATNSGGNGSQPGMVMKTAAGGNIGGVYGDVNSDTLKIQTGGTDSLTITSAGEIHVGSASSTYNVIANNSSTAKLHLSGAGGGSANIELYGSSHTTPKIMTVSTNTAERLRIDANGDHHIKNLNSGSNTKGGALFIGEGADPAGDLPMFRDTHRRPAVYLGGSYPEITLSNDEIENVRHGGIIRFVNYLQSTNTAVGHQYVMGTNGTGTFFEISSIAAAQNKNAHDGFDGYPTVNVAAGGFNYTGLRICDDGSVLKPRTAGFRSGRTSNISVSANSIIIFNTTSNTGGHNTGNHYNTSTGVFTAPQPGRYLFTVQVIWMSVADGQQMDDAFHININNATAGYSGRRAEYVAGTTGNFGFYTDNMTYLFDLNANDTVSVSNKRALTLHGNQLYTTFSGYLLG